MSKGVYVDDCPVTINFRADHVDATVWGWVRELLLNPEATLKGLREEQANREDVSKPLMNRLSVIDDLLEDHQARLEQALDLYLEGGLLKEMLLDRKQRLETTIAGLKKERAELVDKIRAQAITDEDIEGIMQFTAEMGEGLEEAEKDFEKRRQSIDALDLNAVLTVEDGEKIVHASAIGLCDYSSTPRSRTLRHLPSSSACRR